MTEADFHTEEEPISAAEKSCRTGENAQNGILPEQPNEQTPAEKENQETKTDSDDGLLYFSETTVEVSADNFAEAIPVPTEQADEVQPAQPETNDLQRVSDVFAIADGIDPNFPAPSAPRRHFVKLASEKPKFKTGFLVFDRKAFVFAAVCAVFATLLFVLQTVLAIRIFSIVGTVCTSVEEFASLGGKLITYIAISVPTSVLLLVAQILCVRFSLTAEREGVAVEKPFLAMLLLCGFYFICSLTYYIIFFARL